MSTRFDYVLVGGGLQNGLIALALLARQPGVTVALVERDSDLGGNHMWSFHAADVPAAALPIVDPLVEHRWSGYEVRFPRHRRVLESPYCGVPSTRFARVVTAALAAAPGCRLFAERTAIAIGEHSVELAGGTTLEATVVIDARGPSALAPDAAMAFQKFLGLEVALDAPHGLRAPVLMDATVSQADGFRFVYTLPLGADRLLIEDTYFDDDATLDLDLLRERVLEYAGAQGFAVARVDRSEHGVLPLPWRGGCETREHGPLVAGYGGGWFHPATGYSFPVALRLALLVADTPAASLFGDGLRALAAEQNRQLAFAHRLNRMLFKWFPPDQRRNVFERFYHLPEATIRRFYALALTARDRGRILIGRPPRGLSLRAAFGRQVAS